MKKIELVEIMRWLLITPLNILFKMLMHVIKCIEDIPVALPLLAGFIKIVYPKCSIIACLGKTLEKYKLYESRICQRKQGALSRHYYKIVILLLIVSLCYEKFRYAMNNNCDDVGCTRTQRIEIKIPIDMTYLMLCRNMASFSASHSHYVIKL